MISLFPQDLLDERGAQQKSHITYISRLLTLIAYFFRRSMDGLDGAAESHTDADADIKAEIARDLFCIDNSKRMNGNVRCIESGNVVDLPAGDCFAVSWKWL